MFGILGWYDDMMAWHDVTSKYIIPGIIAGKKAGIVCTPDVASHTLDETVSFVAVMSDGVSMCQMVMFEGVSTCQMGVRIRCATSPMGAEHVICDITGSSL